MVPRGEVGLIFAQAGLASGVFDAGLFGGVTMMVMVTTLIRPAGAQASHCAFCFIAEIDLESNPVGGLVNEA